MQYENFKRASEIVNQIKKHERLLDYLNEPSKIIEIKKNGFHIITIGAETTYEHDFTAFAIDFIDTIRKDLNQRIDMLKAQLSLL